MRYVFKAKSKKTVRINTNNYDEAVKEYIENHVVVNREKIDG